VTSEEFDRQVAEHRGYLVRYLHSKVGNWDDAEELAQEALLHLWMYPYKEEVQSFRSACIHRSRYAIWRRMNRKKQPALEPLGEELCEELAGKVEGLSIPDPMHEVVGRDEFRDEFQSALEALVTLPPRARRVFLLHDYGGHTLRSIAVRENVHFTTITRERLRCQERLAKQRRMSQLFEGR